MCGYCPCPPGCTLCSNVHGIRTDLEMQIAPARLTDPYPVTDNLDSIPGGSGHA